METDAGLALILTWSAGWLVVLAFERLRHGAFAPTPTHRIFLIWSVGTLLLGFGVAALQAAPF